VVAPQDYPGLYSGRKRAIYEDAAQAFLQRGVQLCDSFVSVFVKAEKINFSSKPDPAPRVIQPRRPVFNLAVGRYLKQFEGRLCEGFKKLCGYRVILKGLNATGVAECLRANWCTFKQPLAVMLDASRFDQHVSVEALEFEHSIYNAVFRSAELAKLLRMQLTNRGYGYTSCGHRVKYEIKGCRMSGDINTGMGNCLLMSTLVLAYCEHVGLKSRLANNGDDCTLMIEKRDAGKLRGLEQWFLDFGFRLTVEGTTEVFERIKFCQAQPVLTGSGWRMVRDIHTAPSKDLVSLLSVSDAKEFAMWRHAIGSCGLELTRGVPMWEKFYSDLLAGGVVAAEGVSERITDSGLGYMAAGVVGSQITDEARHSFWLAFGIEPDHQIAYEQTPTHLEWAEPTPLMFDDITSEFISHYAAKEHA